MRNPILALLVLVVLSCGCHGSGLSNTYNPATNKYEPRRQGAKAGVVALKVLGAAITTYEVIGGIVSVDLSALNRSWTAR